MTDDVPGNNNFPEITPENHAKFNEVMPESDEATLCMKITKPISAAGYNKNFLPKLNKIIAEKGKARILIYYKDPKGWEQEAAETDLKTVFRLGDKVEKLALVNPPPKEIKSMKIKQTLSSATVKYFEEKDLKEALVWVKS